MVDFNNVSYLAEGADFFIMKLDEQPYILRIRKNIEKYQRNENIKTQNWFDCNDSYQYYTNVLVKITPKEYLLSKFELVHLDNTILENISQRINKHSKHNHLMSSSSSALLLSDASRLLTSNDNIWTIEIKPKWGFCPYGDMPNAHNIQKSYCRYYTQQISHIKSNKYNINVDSQYCPLDLFSRCPKRISRALVSLFDSPQNNLKIFENGSLKDISDINVYVQQFLIDSLIEILQIDSNSGSISVSNNEFCKSNEIFDCCLSNSCVSKLNKFGVFPFIKHMQTLDKLGIDKIADIWISLSFDDQIRYANELTNYTPETWNLLEISKDALLDPLFVSLRNFLISMTFRDISIFISFTSNHSPVLRSLPNIFSSDPKIFDYRISITDLDPKSSHNIPYYRNINSTIIHKFIEKMNAEPCNHQCELISQENI